jgi:O-antigen ligase
MAERSAAGHVLARAIGAASLCACGVVLLVAGKTIAGVAFVGMALILVGPLRRVVASERRRVWLRALAIAALLAVATVAIAGTDIRPDQRRTGFAPVDKVAAIVDDFVDVVSGQRGTPARHTRSAPADA